MDPARKIAQRRSWGAGAAYAVSGILAAAAGMAWGHLAAAVLDPALSPVLAVGSAVIDATPTPVKDWAVAHLGTNDKPVLIAGVGVVTVVLAGVAGVLSRRRPAVGVGFLVVLVALATAAAATRPTASFVEALGPGLVAGIVGIGVLLGLRQLVGSWSTRRVGQRDVGPTGPDPSDLVPMAPRRRGFLLGAGGVAVATLAAGTLGQRLADRPVDTSALKLPTPSDVPPALPAGLETTVAGITPLRTPVNDFYRVDTNLTIPRIDLGSWTLSVDGDVDHPFTLTMDQLLKMPLVERDITMTCVSNEVGGGYVGAARWTGVRVADILDRAGVRPGPDQVLSTATDGFTISTPLAVLRDGRDALVAVGMDGAPLSPTHGFPARLITPGLYGFVGATKWLTGLTLTTYAKEKSYWTERGWATDAPIRTASRIDTPQPLSTIKAGRTAIGGVAWAQHRGIKDVEVRIDGGAWRRATLGPDVDIDYWRQWYLPWEATPGAHRLAVRAVDGTGTLQTQQRRTPFPSGSSGIQEIVVNVA